jgi:thiol:disulfide interchange protein
MRAIALSLLLCTSLAPLAAQDPAPVTGPFDAGRDSFKDLAAAKAEAKQTGKRILMDVGGNWCPWCRRLHAFWDAQPAVKSLRDQNYVFVLVNYSKENKNTEFLAQFPKFPGFPHLFVLDADGKVIQSQETGVLEQDKGYSPEKITEFLKKWKG